jgi:multicomponent Na+:H+ antiporter subunit F
MFEVASVAMLIALTGIIARAVAGPTVFDRTQAVNTAGTVAMLLLAIVGFLNDRPEFLDIAIIYGLLNVIGTIAVLKFFRYGSLGDSGDQTRHPDEASGSEHSS